MKNLISGAESGRLAIELPLGERRGEFAKVAGDVAKRADYDHDVVRYICYKMLADCQDHNLAMAFLRLCKEI